MNLVDVKDMKPVFDRFLEAAKKRLVDDELTPEKIFNSMFSEQNKLMKIFEERAENDKRLSSDLEERYTQRAQMFVLAILDELNEWIFFKKAIDGLEEIENINKEDYKLNATFELIDMIHFIMEGILLAIKKLEKDDEGRKYLMKKTIYKLTEDYLQKGKLVKDDSYSYYEEISTALSLLLDNIHWKHWKTYKEYTPIELERTINMYNDIFIKTIAFILQEYGYTLEDIYLFYMIKRLENEDRQERGY